MKLYTIQRDGEFIKSPIPGEYAEWKPGKTKKGTKIPFVRQRSSFFSVRFRATRLYIWNENEERK